MKTYRSLILILTLVLSALIAYGILFTMPSPKGIDEEGFSSARVVRDLEVIAKEPHSVAHPEEKDKVLNYLKAQLESLGGETQIYVYPNIKARQFTFDAKNVLATFPTSKASEDTTYLMMVAHYDSCQPWKKKGKTHVSMGASDDGYGLGVILECIRQALKYREDWHQGIKVLFTDGEEVDLQGMKAAYKYNKEIFHNVGLIINAESRGPFGPTLLFETSPGNERLIKLYAEYAQCPFAYSLKAPDSVAKNVNMRQWFRVKDGSYTIARLDQDNGNYSILNGTWEQNADSGVATNYWWGMDSGVIGVKFSDKLPEGVRQMANILRKGLEDGTIDPFRRRIVAQDGTVKNDGSRRFTPEELLHMDWLCHNVVGSIPSFDQILPYSQAMVRELGIYRDSIPTAKEVSVREDFDRVR